MTSQNVEVLSQHVLVDLYECDVELLDDLEYVRQTLVDSAEKMNCTVLKEAFHRFSPQGVSGVLVIAESHLSIHTWPEKRFCALDLFTCGDTSQLGMMPEILQKAFRANRADFKIYPRGLVPMRSPAS
jgi:S-adenosylmethionine decarboxylase proenzyme